MTKARLLFQTLMTASVVTALAACGAKTPETEAEQPNLSETGLPTPDAAALGKTDGGLPKTATPPTDNPKAKSPDKAALLAKPLAKPASEIIEPEIDPNAAFHAACTDRITAKMIDPSAVDITYTPLAGEDGFQAAVNLQKQGDGGSIRLDFTCRRTAGGDVFTQLISD